MIGCVVLNERFTTNKISSKGVTSLCSFDVVCLEDCVLSSLCVHLCQTVSLCVFLCVCEKHSLNIIPGFSYIGFETDKCARVVTCT